MTTAPRNIDPPATITVRVPLTVARRGGRKLVIAPDGSTLDDRPIARHVDNAMVKAIARAFRWRDMLETGEYTTVREMARAEGISESYVGRVLRLTLLAPDIVEAILNGRTAPDLRIERLMRTLEVQWDRQRRTVRLIT